ncbi:MAG TPA: hypothetical protein VGR35_13550 [Tepidisphaeraceae bacterium]|nr:hypothetical protein [Tepidisphaeraceae bacterium]
MFRRLWQLLARSPFAGAATRERSGAFPDDSPTRDLGGTISGAVGSRCDISDRKRFEAALIESERFARSTVEALTGHIAIIDGTGEILATRRGAILPPPTGCARRSLGSAQITSPPAMTAGPRARSLPRAFARF